MLIRERHVSDAISLHTFLQAHFKIGFFLRKPFPNIPQHTRRDKSAYRSTICKVSCCKSRHVEGKIWKISIMRTQTMPTFFSCMQIFRLPAVPRPFSFILDRWWWWWWWRCDATEASEEICRNRGLDLIRILLTRSLSRRFMLHFRIVLCDILLKSYYYWLVTLFFVILVRANCV